MDKIIELICEEARRRPGKDPVLKLYSATFEVQMRVMEIMEGFRESERTGKITELLQGGGDDDVGIKRS